MNNDAKCCQATPHDGGDFVPGRRGGNDRAL